MKVEKTYHIELNTIEVTGLSCLLCFITKKDIDNILTREGWDDDIAMSSIHKTKKDLENLLVSVRR